LAPAQDLVEPHFFLDRGLGSRILPTALRNAGWQLTTMDERYGKHHSQRISDEQWIAEATDRMEILLCKDTAIASNPAEARLVYMCQARVFALANANLAAETMTEVFLLNSTRIVRMAAHARGPYVVAISAQGMRRRRLAYP
jgi:PIN like domain